MKLRVRGLDSEGNATPRTCVNGELRTADFGLWLLRTADCGRRTFRRRACGRSGLRTSDFRLRTWWAVRTADVGRLRTSDCGLETMVRPGFSPGLQVYALPPIRWNERDRTRCGEAGAEEI